MVEEIICFTAIDIWRVTSFVIIIVIILAPLCQIAPIALVFNAWDHTVIAADITGHSEVLQCYTDHVKSLYAGDSRFNKLISEYVTEAVA